ncbi:unnamed protein product [Danaus chrysippus]|uniref:(African queen) hypothetical protein n=1 Tax=Danaus chrysippus TaxID=151541 RepID=A0A8J2R7S9_9NEOP|nr:unnamed protein product [Danaus chrysippus]
MQQSALTITRHESQTREEVINPMQCQRPDSASKADANAYTQEASPSTVKAIPSYAALVKEGQGATAKGGANKDYMFQSSTTEDDIKEYLTEKGIEAMGVEVLQSKMPTNFRSFKLVVKKNVYKETWLHSDELSLLDNINLNFYTLGTSAMNLANSHHGRPYGGVAILWHKNINATPVKCDSPRLTAIHIKGVDTSILLITVYMPTECNDNLEEFSDCLSKIITIADEKECHDCIIMGDFNADPQRFFGKELLQFANENMFSCVDIDEMPKDSYTFLSDAHNSTSWLDHCMISYSLKSHINSISIDYNVDWSDHRPLSISLNLKNLNHAKSITEKPKALPITWKAKSDQELIKYAREADLMLHKIKPLDVTNITQLSREVATKLIDNNYERIVSSLRAAANRVFALKPSNGSKKRRIPGWNERVKQAYATSKEACINWVAAGRPSTGVVAEKRSSTKKDFKREYKKCLRDSEEIKASRIALSLHNKNFNSFWRQTNKAMKTNNKTLAVEVNGKSDERDIAKEFASHFGFTTSHPADKTPMSCRIISISAAEVDKIIQCENRNKAAGHDGLVAEHLIYSGPYLPTLLAALFSACLTMCHIPTDMMKTTVV